MSPTIQQRDTDKSLWNLHHLTDQKAAQLMSQQQLRLLWRQFLGGGLQAISSNQSSVTLEQLPLWVNNSRSRTFLTFIREPSISKLAKRAGVNITQWQWPILHSIYLEKLTPFLQARIISLPTSLFPLFKMYFAVPLEVGLWMWQNMCRNFMYIIAKDLWKGIKLLSWNKVEMAYMKTSLLVLCDSVAACCLYL